MPSTQNTNCQVVSTNGVQKTTDSEINLIDIESSVSMRGYEHAVHCMFWAKWSGPVIRRLDPRAAINMQVRCDGKLGFPGGMVDNSLDNLNSAESIEEIVDALNRELKEEMNFDVENHKITQSNYMFSHKNENIKLMMHFYQYEMTLEDFTKMETDAYNSEEFGNELFGVCRVPIFTYKDNYKGFPAFLDNVFCGTSRDQLLKALVELEIMTSAEVESAESFRRLKMTPV